VINCEIDVDLYFYGELDAADCVRIEAHLRQCDACRQRLDDLHAIRSALTGRPVVDAPPAGDWSGFTARLDRSLEPSFQELRSTRSSPPSLARRFVTPLRFRRAHGLIARADAASARSRARGVRTGHARAAALAAIIVIVALGISVAVRVRHSVPAARHSVKVEDLTAPVPAGATPDPLREATAEHLERSKLVVLGLTALDPKQTHAADWQYERRLAGTLLDDTRLYRQAAQQRGMTDVARVMRDLETVLIETSMSDTTDSEALARVQRLIAKRDLLAKMQLAGTN